MKWKEIKKNFKFKDGTEVIQKHQTHMYDCYELEYDGRKIILSKDHLIKINIEKLPLKAQEEIRKICVGKIPLKEDIKVEILADLNEEEKTIIRDWLLGENKEPVIVEDISESTKEAYIFNLPNRTFGVEVFVQRIPLEYESQKIDDNNYWMPVEGLAYLFGKYGELEV